MTRKVQLEADLLRLLGEQKLLHKSVFRKTEPAISIAPTVAKQSINFRVNQKVV